MELKALTHFWGLAYKNTSSLQHNIAVMSCELQVAPPSSSDKRIDAASCSESRLLIY